MTLTQAAAFTQKAFKFIVIPGIIITVVWMFIGILSSGQILPDQYITPDFMCGQLPELEVSSLAMSSDAQFSIETTSGAVPDLPSVVNVFKYAHPGQSLLALEEAQRTAESLGFVPGSYTRISATEYQWVNDENKQTLVIETGNQNFTLTTDYTDPSVDTYSKRLPTEENAKTLAKQYLQNISQLNRDYSKGEQKTYLIQITSDGEFREAPSLSEADLIRVDFFRTKDLITISPELVGTDEIGSTLQTELEQERTTTIETETSDSIEVKKYSTDIYNDSPIFGNITVYVGGTPDDQNRSYKIFGINYTNWYLNNFACGTYRLISPQEAIRRVQAGEGILAYLLPKYEIDRIVPYEPKSVEQMTILDVSLGYLDLAQRQPFLQPVFVIQGEANFGGEKYGEFYYYVPAIDYDAIPADAGKPAQTPDPSISE